MRKEFVIDGRRFSTMEGLYDEVECVFTYGLRWKTGQNLNAFPPLLKVHYLALIAYLTEVLQLVCTLFTEGEDYGWHIH